MVLLTDISKHYAGQTVLNHISVPLSKNRTALVGTNGSGKSTLMKIIAGLEQPDTGTIITKKNCSVEYLPQQAAYDFKGTVFDEVNAWRNSDRLNFLKEQEESILKILETSQDEALFQRLTEIIEEIGQLEISEQKKNSVENILLNLGFDKESWQKEAKTLSGGWQMRIALARVLVREPDVIMLDEPTNYLDIATIDYLSNWILEYSGQILLVSHDRDFLNRVVEETWEIFRGDISIYRGNYDYYIKEKDVRVEVLSRQREKQLDEIKVLQEFYEKNRFNAATAPLAQSKFKQMKKIKEELIELPRIPPVMTFKLPTAKRSGDIVAELDTISHSYGDNKVISDYKRIFARKERVALVGRNGFGKSTLMNIISGEITPTSGTFNIGSETSVSYFRQHEITLLPQDMNVLQFVESVAPFNMIPKVKSLLGAFLFYEEAWDKKISVLSGGEKVRLAFIKMILNPGNLFLLDEPTTHLDIDSKEVILKTLKDLDATIIFVSHDSHFINELATSLVYFRGKQDILNFPGTYTEYLNLYGHDIIEDENSKSKEVKTKAEVSKGKSDYSKQKEIRNRLNKLKKEIPALEKLIADKENELSNTSLSKAARKNCEDEIKRLYNELEEKIEENRELSEN